MRHDPTTTIERRWSLDDLLRNDDGPLDELIDGQLAMGIWSVEPSAGVRIE